MADRLMYAHRTETNISPRPILKKMTTAKKPANSAQKPAENAQPIADQKNGKLVSFDDMLDAIDTFEADPIPAAPSTLKRGKVSGTVADVPMWEASANVVAACELVGWGIPFAKRNCYGPTKIDTLGAEIGKGAKGTDKKGKYQKHLILQFVNGLNGRIPSMVDGETVSFGLLAKYIHKYADAFDSLNYAKNIDSMLAKMADYTCRYIIREEDGIRLSLSKSA